MTDKPTGRERALAAIKALLNSPPDGLGQHVHPVFGVSHVMSYDMIQHFGLAEADGALKKALVEGKPLFMNRRETRRLHARDIAYLRAIWSLDDDDADGGVASWRFIIAEELFRRGCVVPAEWGLRPPFTVKRGDAPPRDWPEAEVAALHAHPDALRYFGGMLARLARSLPTPAKG